MPLWHFATPTVAEAPFAWNYLHNRYRMDRSYSVQEVTPGVYELVRFDAYTNELGAVNYPPNPNADHTDFWPAPSTGLHYFRGGYDWIVDDTIKAQLIASGIGITSANFTPVDNGMSVTSVNGFTGAVILTFTDVQAGRQPVVRSGNIQGGNVTLANTAGNWVPIPAFEIDIPASVGDYVEISPSFMWQPTGTNYLELVNLVGSTIQRFGSTGTSTPTPAGQGDPSLYAQAGTYRTSGALFGFTVTAGDLDSGNVRFALATKGTGGDTLYASSNYPFRWTAKNLGPVL